MFHGTFAWKDWVKPRKILFRLVLRPRLKSGCFLITNIRRYRCARVARRIFARRFGHTNFNVGHYFRRRWVIGKTVLNCAHNIRRPIEHRDCFWIYWLVTFICTCTTVLLHSDDLCMYVHNVFICDQFDREYVRNAVDFIYAATSWYSNAHKILVNIPEKKRSFRWFWRSW
jgi:hypothetical protein